ncbi:unnamed protein product, partial [Musa banksii]
VGILELVRGPFREGPFQKLANEAPPRVGWEKPHSPIENVFAFMGVGTTDRLYTIISQSPFIP